MHARFALNKQWLGLAWAPINEYQHLQQLSQLGYRNLSADDLVTLSIHGVSADYIRRLEQNGMAKLSADQLVRLRLAGFEPR